MEPSQAFNSVEHLRSIIDAIPSALVMIDESGRIVLVNSQAEVLFGYRRAEILNEPVEVLVPLRFRHNHPELRQNYFNKASARPMGSGRDLYGLRKDGREFPIEIGLNPIRTDEGLFVLSAIVDITERKRLEARFRATVESAPTAMIMIDGAGRIVLVNQETSQLFGYERDELMNQKVEVLVPKRFARAHPELRVNYFAESGARRMGAGRDLFGLRKDGSEFPVEIGLNPIETDEGQFVLAAIVDLTERKRSLEALKKANEALELSNIELQQFAYIASHDLQTPLRAICGYAQCLQNDYGDQLDETASMYMDRMINGTIRMQNLINDLLVFSRVDSKAQPFKPTDLNKAFDEALALLAVGPEVEANITKSTLPTVVGDSSQLMQVFLNLIGNALKYSGSNDAKIHVDAKKEGADWIIRVKDNGIGIEKQYLEKIFNIFCRLHSKNDYPGTGIGLALCRRIVHRHGGEIWAESLPGHGSTFFFRLTVADTQNRNEKYGESSEITVS